MIKMGIKAYKLKRDGKKVKEWDEEINFLINLKKEITGIYLINREKLIVYIGYDNEFITYSGVVWRTLYDFQHKIVKSFKKLNRNIYV